jgi:hypothetical protein
MNSLRAVNHPYRASDFPTPEPRHALQPAPQEPERPHPLFFFDTGRDEQIELLSCSVETNMLLLRKNTENKPDGAGAIIVVESENDLFVLGNLRSNPALRGYTTQHGRPYPSQINTSLGGYVPKPDLPLSKAISDNVGACLIPNQLRGGPLAGSNAYFTVQRFYQRFENTPGWSDKISQHTRCWEFDGLRKTMCYFTAVKHLRMETRERDELEQALIELARLSDGRAANPMSIPDRAYRFFRLDEVVENAVRHVGLDDVKKAAQAEKHNIVPVFNDMAIAALRHGGAL